MHRLVPIALLLASALPAGAGTFARPLTVTDDLAGSGTITVETPAWRVIFDEAFNGGPARLFDLTFDPADNLATASAGGFYSQGGLFDYDVYLGTSAANQYEYMTTMGFNASPGSLALSILEATPARVRIRQQGFPRLNNATGPPGDIFPELPLIAFTTIWTLYPTGKTHVDFVSTVEAAGMIVDAGPGGAGAGVDAPGCCGLEDVVDAVGGTDFRATGVWAGDTIESATGGWGPIRVTTRESPSRLRLDAPVPAGTALDFIVRRTNVVNETISIHADGDPGVVTQCFDPAVSRWQGGSDGDPLWDTDIGDVCMGLFSTAPASQDTVLAHWTRDRAFGSLLSFYEPWTTATFGVFNDSGFTDISYTQLGRFGIRPAEGHDRHFLAQIGSTATADLPDITSVADALPFSDDFRTPFAEALVGTLATGPDIDVYGFDTAAGAYGIVMAGCGPGCQEAVLRFDASGGGRSADAYKTPAVDVEGIAPFTDEVAVAISTDGGASFATLDPALYNLTGVAEQSETGADRVLFQYLADVPGSATGTSAVALRFRIAPPVCSAAPLGGCREAGKSVLVLKDRDGASRDKLVWKWVRGDATSSADLGNPLVDTGFTLCAYAGATPAPIAEGSVAGGGTCGTGPCWKALGSGGFRFSDASTSQAGIKRLRLGTGGAGKAKVVAKAAGTGTPLPSMPLDVAADVIAQLVRSDAPECWESRFPPTSVRINQPMLFKAKASTP